MTPYANRSGDSGIFEYELGENSIRIRFVNDHKIYVYDQSKPGRAHVERMSHLAIAGKGLATYISRNVKANYSHTE